MGQILDVVPNHMGVMGADNAWWMDVLENGEASSYACFFDIDWQPIDLVLAGKVLVPVLGSHYGVALERGELRLVFERAGGTFSFTYFEHRFPVDPVSYRGILERALEQDLAPGARSELDEPGERVRRVAAAQRDRGRQARHPQPRQGSTQGPPRRACRGRPGDSGRHRRGRRRTERRVRRRPRRAARAARSPGISPGVLARGVRPDQLPPLLRYQRSRRAAHGGRGGVRGHPPPGPGASRRGARGRPAHRPSRRAVRSGRLFPPPPGALRPVG